MVRNIELEPNSIRFANIENSPFNVYKQAGDKISVLTKNTRYPSVLIDFFNIAALSIGVTSLGLATGAVLGGYNNKQELADLYATSIICACIYGRVQRIRSAYDDSLHLTKKNLYSEPFNEEKEQVLASLNKNHADFSQRMKDRLKGSYPITSWLMNGEVNYTFKEKSN